MTNLYFSTDEKCFFFQVTLEEGDESGEAGESGDQTAISGEEGGGESEDPSGEAGM